MLIETVKTFPNGKTIDLNLEQICFICDRDKINEKTLQLEKADGCAVTLTCSVVIELMISRADLKKKMVAYK